MAGVAEKIRIVSSPSKHKAQPKKHGQTVRQTAASRGLITERQGVQAVATIALLS
jgi:hypothetical protein